MSMKFRAVIAVLCGLSATAQAALICDLDATVPGSVTTDISGVAVNWLDQSGSGNNAGDETIVGSPTFPSVSLSASGLAGIDLGNLRNGYRLFNPTEQDSIFDFDGAASANSGFAVFVAVKVDTVTTGKRDTVFANHGNAATAASFILKYENGAVTAVLGGTPYAKTSGAGYSLVGNGDTIVIAFNYNAGTGALELWDSNNMSSLTNSKAAANFSSTQPLYLGTSENGGQYIDGSLGEVLVYDGVLDATTFSNKCAELADKWTVAAEILPPAGLEAVGSFSSVILDWIDDGTGLLDYYTLYRGTSSGTNNYTFSTNLTQSGFTDTAVINDTTYYYAVTATDTNGNETAFSDEASATPVAASGPGVAVSFTNSIPVASGNNNLGTVTLQFTVDGSGNVTLDASATGATAIGLDTVDGWDGPVGTVSSTGAYNTVFSLLLDDSGQGMKLSDLQGGALGVSGQNAWRIDRPGVESISATASIPAGRMELWEVDWVNRNTSATEMLISGPVADYTNNLVDFNGTWVISNELVRVENSESLVFGNAIGNGDLGEGYGLAGLKFDIIDAAPVPGVIVTFPNTIPINSGPTNRLEELTFDFTVDGSGNVTLDASTTSSNSATISTVDGWDGPKGFITYTGAYSSAFSMTFSADGNVSNITNLGVSISEAGGGGLGVFGKNAWRIDNASSTNVESLVVNLSLPSGGTVDFQNADWVYRANATVDMLLVTPTVSQTNNLPTASGSLSLSGVTLLDSQSISFSNPVAEDENDGFTLAGFRFDILAPVALNYADWVASYELTGSPDADLDYDYDNDGLDNLYEFAVGGDPTNGTVAPAYIPTSRLVGAGFEYVYTRRDPVPVDMQYYLNVASDLIVGDWADAGYSVLGEGNADPGFKTVTNVTTVVEDEKFIKLVVEQN